MLCNILITDFVMKQYFKNLLAALAGRLPLRDEVERERKKCASEYQQLIENLRTRLAEKEQDARETLEDVMAQNESRLAVLRDKLKAANEETHKANRTIGQLLMAKTMLEKTNTGLLSLCKAMENDDVDAMMEVTQHLDWNNDLTLIAQLHIQVLRRRNELDRILRYGGGE